MTKCFLTGKTYPDYEPTDADQRQDFQRELYKAIGSWGDFVNHEQTQLAVECAKLIINLNNNNPEAFKTVLSAINMMAQERTEKALISQTDYVSLYSDLAGYLVNEAQANGGLDEVFEETDNGDEHYTEEAQDMFNQYSDDVCEILDNYFETDDVCRNGKPIADCECC